ncbi:hypothetical protein L2E82_20822 [Cichorium intybus]|uniref:Uncharacterized protein n=1 Tax=Cichorium intybus TaxID=13427 RepID=A0ACB9DUP9_CICIN|nr:hypothetical protein L2E82_20822 [Cichorium intybus]
MCDKIQSNASRISNRPVSAPAILAFTVKPITLRLRTPVRNLTLLRSPSHTASIDLLFSLSSKFNISIRAI